jgi:hypothetical protein
LPKALSGERLTARQIEAELATLQPLVAAGRAQHPALAAAIDELEAAQPITGKLGLRALVSEDLRTRRALRHLNRALAVERRAHGGPELAALAQATRRRGALARRLGMLTAAERLFRGWHLFHKPLTFVLLGAVILHVVAHYIYAAQLGSG